MDSGELPDPTDLHAWLRFTELRGIPMDRSLAVRDRLLDDVPASDAARVERACSLGNKAAKAIDLQVRRIRLYFENPLDDEFEAMIWADIPFLLNAVSWMRRAAVVARAVPRCQDAMTAAIQVYDTALSNYFVMRNVQEHLNDYALEVGGPGQKQRRPDGRPVGRRQLEVAACSPDEFRWLGYVAKYDDALTASAQLLQEIRSCRGRLSPTE